MQDEEIIEFANNYFGVCLMFNGNKVIAPCRHIVYRFLRDELNYSFTHISNMFARNSHSTVSSAITKNRNNPKLAQEYTDFVNAFKANDTNARSAFARNAVSTYRGETVLKNKPYFEEICQLRLGGMSIGDLVIHIYKEYKDKYSYEIVRLYLAEAGIAPNETRKKPPTPTEKSSIFINKVADLLHKHFKGKPVVQTRNLNAALINTDILTDDKQINKAIEVLVRDNRARLLNEKQVSFQ